MRVLCFSILLATALAYERINVFSDQESIASIGRDSDRDVITVRSTTGLGISFKGYSNTNITHPEGLEEFRVTITTPRYNMGRYRLTVPFEGLHVTMKYDHQRPLTGLCDIFASLLPCFRVKQCSSSLEESVYDIDLDDAIWTPISLVPYSVLKPTSIVGEDWVRVANIIVPSEYLKYENYVKGGCVSSVYNTNDLFNVESKEWYPHEKDAKMRFVELTLLLHSYQDLHIYDAHYVSSPLVIPHISSYGKPDSHVDLIFHQHNDDYTISRYLPNGKRILYPEREFPFWTGDVKMDLKGEQLHLEGYISTQDGSYSPYLPIYDSRTATVMYLPKGVYVDLAEMKLMYDTGKIPAYFSYVTNVDTDLSYEASKPQIIVFVAEASIYPLPPMLDINISLPIHLRYAASATNVTMPLPAFFANSPVRDTILTTQKTQWWEPAYPYVRSISIALPVKVENKKQTVVLLGLAGACVLIFVVETAKWLFGGKCP
ncbi:hypothetical protein WA577_003662 [Blastocystis sp. JDR]